MPGKLSFSIAINLLTENFKKGTNNVKASLRSMQAQILTFAAAMGFAGVSLSNFFSQLVQVARETSRAVTALKNVSGSAAQFADNSRFITAQAKKYGVYVNDLTSNFAKFTAAATNANMPMEDQRKLFESLSRASGAFGLTADETNGVFLAVTQMMGKGKIQAEELRGQLGERMPIAMQAMAKAAGTTVAGLDQIMKEGKLLSADVLPKFADVLNEMLPNIDTDNIETSLNRLKNVFQEFTQNTGIQNVYKKLIDELAEIVDYAKDKISMLITFIISLVSGKLLVNIISFFAKSHSVLNDSVKKYEVAQVQKQMATQKRIDAEKLYEATLTAYETKENDKRLVSKAQVNKAKKALDAAELNVRKANLAVQTASENAAAVQSLGFWKRTGAAVVSSAKRATTALKAVWSTVWPMALITAIAGVVAKMRELYTEAKRIKNILSEYKKEVEVTGNTAEIVRMQSLLRVMNDRESTQEVINQAQSELQSMLGVEYKSQEEINKLVAKRIDLLKEAARADLHARTIAETEDRNKTLSSGTDMTIEQLKSLSPLLKNRWRSGSDANKLYDEIKKILGKNGVKYDYTKHSAAVLEPILKEIEANNRKMAYAESELDAIQKRIGVQSNTPITPDSDTDKEKTPLQKEEEKYAEAVKALTNKLNNRAISEEDYKKQLNDLNKKTYDTLSGMLTPEEASKNKTYQIVRGFSVSSDFSEIQNNYESELRKYTNQLHNGALSEEDYLKAKQDLLESTIKAIASLDNLSETEKTILNGMLSESQNLQSSFVKRAEMKTYDTTFDYKKSEKDIMSGQLSVAKENLANIRSAYNEGAKDLIDELNAAMSNVESLEKALKIAEVKKDVKDLSRQLNEGLYSGVKDIASSSDRVVSAFSSLRDVFSDEDATTWERIMAVWNAMINGVDAFMSIVKTIENLTEITKELSKAKETENSLISTSAEVAAAAAGQAAMEGIATREVEISKTVTAAKNAEAAAKINAAYAGIPFAGPAIAAAQIALMQSMVSAAAIPGFSGGGIITHGSPTGDKTLIRTNRDEMVLTRHQQATLFQIANGKGIKTNGGGDVEFKIRYDQLVGVLRNGNQKSRRGK